MSDIRLTAPQAGFIQVAICPLEPENIIIPESCLPTIKSWPTAGFAQILHAADVSDPAQAVLGGFDDDEVFCEPEWINTDEAAQLCMVNRNHPIAAEFLPPLEELTVASAVVALARTLRAELVEQAQQNLAAAFEQIVGADPRTASRVVLER